MSNREKYILTPIFLVFIYHGLIYYILPQYHYLDTESEGGWPSYIKYACLALGIPFALSIPVKSRPWFAIGIIIFLIPMIPIALSQEKLNQLSLQFLIPILGYFFAPFLLNLFYEEDSTKNYAILFLTITTSFALFEFIYGGYFESFSRSGTRTTGPFVNPNNTGIIVAIISTLIHVKFRTIKINIYTFFCCITTVILTGSKTAAIIYAVGFILSQGFLSRLFTIPVIFIISFIYISGIIDFSINEDLRGLSLESARIRARDYEYLLASLSSASFYELLFGFSNNSLVDNSYIDIFTFGGIYTLSFFIIIQTWSSVVSLILGLKNIQILFLLLFLAMLSTNVPRLWPMAYAFWAMVGVVALWATSTDRGARRYRSAITKEIPHHVHR